MATYQGGLERPGGVADETGGDWFSQNAAGGGAPQYGSGPSGAGTVDDIQRAAVELLGHPLSDPTPWVGQKDFYQNLKNSQEAQNYAKQQATKAPAAAGPSGGPNPGDLLNQLKAAVKSGAPNAQDLFNQYFQARGAQPEDWSYWGPKLAQDPEYFAGRLQNADAFGGGGAPGTPGNQEFNYPSFNEQFTAPSGLTEENDPGFQARMKLGADALQRSAAAKGSVLDTGTLKDLNTYAQNFASNEYGQVYNRAVDTYNQHLQNYQTGFNNALQTFGTNFGVDQSLWQRALTEGNTGFQRYLSLADLGLAGAGGAANAGGTFGNQAGTGYTGIGNAGAAGTVAGSNAWANSLGELANYGSQYWYGNRGNRTGNGYGVGMGTPGF